MIPEHAIINSADIYETNLWRCWPAICVDRLDEIPIDYPGPMGVPITIMSRFSPEQFELIGISKHEKLTNGREPYKRIFIRNKAPKMPDKVDLVELFREMGIPIDFQLVRQMPEDAMIIERSGT